MTASQLVYERDEFRARVKAGLQCPECYGVRVSLRQTRFDPPPTGYLCDECGCQWSRPIKV